MTLPTHCNTRMPESTKAITKKNTLDDFQRHKCLKEIIQKSTAKV